MDYAQFGASGATALVVFLFLKFMREEGRKRDKQNTLFVSAINKNTRVTKSADEYLRQRNGRDTEAHKETLKAIKEVPDTLREIAEAQQAAIIKAVRIGQQHVEHQHVEEAVIDKLKENS